jgi:hypothetical protein
MIIFADAPDYHYIAVGKSGCTEIIPYGEPGEMAYVIWFECRFENGEVERVNGRTLSAIKFTEDDDLEEIIF